MFSLEFVSGRPLGSAQYYSLVVREPYMVGRTCESDIVLDHDDIVEEHALLTVVRESEALEHQQRRLFTQGMNVGVDKVEVASDYVNGGVLGSFLNDTQDMGGVVSWNYPEMHTCWGEEDEKVSEDAGDGERAFLLSTSILRGDDPLVLRVVKPAGGGGRILANETEVGDQPVYLADGAQVQFGDQVRLRLCFRPLVVSIARTALAADRVRELEFMYHRLGATLTRHCGPTPNLDMPQPIGLLHCAEVIQNDAWCLMALASGYSIVHPRYVLEWFAALAQSASSPLSVLPSPMRFEVPIQCCFPAAAQAPFYLRPESDICPFPLYRIPTSATRKRSRDALFKGQKFFFLTSAVEQHYGSVVPLCGGEVYHPENATRVAKEALLKKDGSAEDDDKAHNGKKEDDAVGHYIVVDLNMEKAMRHTDVRGLAAVQQILDDSSRVGVAFRVISEQSLFYSLLTNRFTVFEVTWPPAPEVIEHETPRQQKQHSLGSTMDVDDSPMHIEIPASTQGRDVFSTPCTSRSVKKVSHLERRVASGSKERAASPIANSKKERKTTELVPPLRIGRGAKGGGQLVSLHAAGSIVEAVMYSVRVFYLKVKPKLEVDIAGLRRDMFPPREILKHAHGCRAQSLRYRDRLKALLLDAGNASYAKDIHRSLENCREVLQKARCILECADHAAQQRTPLANRPRRASAADATRRRCATPLNISPKRRPATPFDTDPKHESGVRSSSPLVSTVGQRTPRRTRRTSLSTPRLHRAGCGTKASGLLSTDTRTPQSNGKSSFFTPCAAESTSRSAQSPLALTRQTLKSTASTTCCQDSLSRCSPRATNSTRRSFSTSLVATTRSKREGCSKPQRPPSVVLLPSNRATSTPRCRGHVDNNKSRDDMSQVGSKCGSLGREMGLGARAARPGCHGLNGRGLLDHTLSLHSAQHARGRVTNVGSLVTGPIIFRQQTQLERR